MFRKGGSAGGITSGLRRGFSLGGSGSERERLVLTDGGSQPLPGSMRCAGCGSKVGATVLERVLSRLSPIHREDVLAGLAVRDDASVERIPAGMVAVRTIDAFPAIVDDPYLFGQITANHCLSDIHAMGADPRTALAIVTLPLSPDDKMEALLEALLSGAVEVLNAADTAKSPTTRRSRSRSPPSRRSATSRARRSAAASARRRCSRAARSSSSSRRCTRACRASRA